jgi:hypothetical protein
MEPTADDERISMRKNPGRYPRTRARRRAAAAIVIAAVGATAGLAPALTTAAEPPEPPDPSSPTTLGVKAIKGVPAPADGVVGVDGRVWSVSLDGLSLSRISTSTRRAVRAPLGVRGLRGLPTGGQAVAAPDGTIVVPAVTRRGWNLLRRTVDGHTTVVPLPSSKVTIAPTGISDLENGPDGSVWFATSGTIGKVTPAGRVRAWRIPTTNGYPRADRPRLAVASDGRIAFTALGGIGTVSTDGRFGPWQQVAKDPSVPLALLVRGGDDHLWAAGGETDDRYYRQERGVAWSTIGPLLEGEPNDQYLAVNEALAPDHAGGILAVGAQRTNGSTTLDGEFVVRGGFTGTGPPTWTNTKPAEGAPGPMHVRVLGPPAWDGAVESPGRDAIVPLPDGRFWVSLQEWDGWESYEKQQGGRTTPPAGKPTVVRVWRRGGTVMAQVRCVGPTGAWCHATLRAKVAREARRTELTLPAAPRAVNALTTGHVRLWRSQRKASQRGPITVNVLGTSRRIR